MELKQYDGKRVKITDKSGDEYEGIAEYLNEEFCMHEIGREEACLQIVNFMFYKDDIKEIESLEESGYSAPYGKIEIKNMIDGFDSVYDELFCEEDEHVCRMLACLIELEPDISDEIADAVRGLLNCDVSPECKALADQLLEKQKQQKEKKKKK